MLKKSRIFYFFSSLIITVVAGFFAWGAVISVGGNFVNKILSYTEKISADFFPASVSNSVIEEIVLAPEIVLTDFPASAIEVVPIVESLQDQLDDIQEKLDIIQSQVNELIAGQNQNDQVDKLDEDLKEEDLKEYEKTEETVVCTGQININTASGQDLDKIIDVGLVTAQKIIEARPFYSLNDLLKVSGIGPVTLQKITEQGCAYVDPGLVPPVVGGGGGGGPAPVVYPKILISEVKISEKIGDKNVFVELYNPNNDPVYLTDWRIFRNDSSFITDTMLNGKEILKNSYFLITKQGSIWDSPDNPSFDETLNDNDKISLKNPNRDIVDEVSWSTIPAGLSFGRKWDSASGTEQDFELQSLTPKMQNAPVPILASIAITAQATKLIYTVGEELNISGLVITGTYSDGTTQIETILPENISSFNSLAPAIGQILTITISGQSTTYTVDINSAPTLQSIAITTPANKLAYTVGDLLDITGLVVTGTYSDNSTQVETIAPDDVLGFNSSAPAIDQILTITVDSQTTTYTINITEPILPKNLLLNEFFDDWDDEIPLYWTGDDIGSQRVYPSTEVLRGKYSLGIIHNLVGPRNIEQHIIYDKANGVKVEYTAALKVKGSGWIRMGILRPGYEKYIYGDWKRLENSDWIPIELVTTKDDRLGTDLGFRIQTSKKEQSAGLGDIEVNLHIGVVWLSTVEPPENWPLQ